MRYISIYTHEASSNPPSPPSPEMMASMGALIEEGMKSGWLIATEGVQFGTHGLRIASKKGKVSVVDGPFAEAKEVIGGYALLEAPNRDAVIALTRRFLSVAGDGICEIHELYAQPHK
jgi:hypothetical protein